MKISTISLMPKALLLGSASLLLGSCGLLGSSKTNTRQAEYAKLYKEQPASILIMPPINETNHVDASESFYQSLATPLIERGYYVYSPYLALELLQQESAADATPFLEGSLKPFYQVFHADAALFTIIKQWSKSMLNNSIDVEIDYILRSTHSGETLFERKVTASVDTKVAQGFGWMDLVANAISGATTDKIVAARRANNYALYDLPAGKYHESFGKDGDVAVGSQTISGVKVRK